jgi:hypothetical protein
LHAWIPLFLPPPPLSRWRSSATLSGAVYGAVALLELRTFLDAWARDRLGSAIADVRFRAGRIDAVWGVGLQDGRAVVIKAHRTPEILTPPRPPSTLSARWLQQAFPAQFRCRDLMRLKGVF